MEMDGNVMEKNKWLCMREMTHDFTLMVAWMAALWVFLSVDNWVDRKVVDLDATLAESMATSRAVN